MTDHTLGPRVGSAVVKIVIDSGETPPWCGQCHRDLAEGELAMCIMDRQYHGKRLQTDISICCADCFRPLRSALESPLRDGGSTVMTGQEA